MQRRSFIRNSTLTLGALTIGQQNLFASVFTQQSNIRMIRGNVGIYSERGGTIGFLLTDKGIVTIDSQFPDTAKKYMEEVKKLRNAPLTFLLNTHHHGDHTGGNIAFNGIADHVVAHANSLENQQRVATQAGKLPEVLLPDLTFTDEFKMKIGGEKIKASYFGPAHTNGDALYHFEEANVVHLGDLFFNRRHPVIDRSAGANIANWVTVLDRAMDKYNKKTIYVCGHAAEGYDVTIAEEDLKKFQDYLRKLLDFARKEISAGRTRDEFIRNTLVPGADEWKGNGERAFAAAYDEVSSPSK